MPPQRKHSQSDIVSSGVGQASAIDKLKEVTNAFNLQSEKRKGKSSDDSGAKNGKESKKSIKKSSEKTGGGHIESEVKLPIIFEMTSNRAMYEEKPKHGKL